MRNVDKSKFRVLLTKGDQHREAAIVALQEKSYDAAVSNFNIALINYLDALSINRFGKDLSSDHHEAAPHILVKRLNEIGVTDFRRLSKKCVEVLKMKNKASYGSQELTAKHATIARQTVEKVLDFVNAKIDHTVLTF